MYKALLVTLIVSSVCAQSFLEKPQAFNTQDFITGFLMGSGIIARVPNAFPCAVVAESAPNAIHDALVKLQDGGLENIVEAIQELTGELEAISTSCGDAVLQVVNVFGQIKSIVTAPDFAQVAQQRLYQGAERVGRDTAEAVLAAKNHDQLSEGLYLGDIVSLVIWG